MAAVEPAQIGQFELEVELRASPEKAWRALTEEIDKWWLPDFRATGEGSVVRLETRAGGSLVEETPDGNELVWYTVQMVTPGSRLYLVGHAAADWGGPNVSMLKIALAPQGKGSVLTISDSIVGRINDAQLEGIADGWKALFGKGFADYVAAMST